MFCQIFQDAEPGQLVRIITRGRPISKTAFIQSTHGSIYGPFDITGARLTQDGLYEADLTPKNVPPFSLKPDTVLKFDADLLPQDALLNLGEHATDDAAVSVITNTDLLRPIQDAFEETDWIDDEQLVRWADRTLADAGEEHFTRRSVRAS